MKIHPDHVEGIRPDRQDQTSKAKGTADGFANVLNQEVGQTEQAENVNGIAPPPLMNTMGVGRVDLVQPVDKAQQAAMDQVEGLLDTVETYAGHLAAPGGDSLRQAYAALEDLESGVAQLKAELPDDNQALQGMVNELDVLSRTEKMKFNRGDYL